MPVLKRAADHLYEYWLGYALTALGAIAPADLQAQFEGLGIPLKWAIFIVGLIELAVTAYSNGTDQRPASQA